MSHQKIGGFTPRRSDNTFTDESNSCQSGAPKIQPVVSSACEGSLVLFEGVSCRAQKTNVQLTIGSVRMDALF